MVFEGGGRLVKVVHVHVKLEVPDNATEIAFRVREFLTFDFEECSPLWQVKEVH